VVIPTKLPWASNSELEDSGQTPVGYPMVNVRDIESGKARVTRDLFGA
jgi:hypothetical protein